MINDNRNTKNTFLSYIFDCQSIETISNKIKSIEVGVDEGYGQGARIIKNL